MYDPRVMPRYKKSSPSNEALHEWERDISPEEQVLVCLRKNSQPLQRRVIENYLIKEYGTEYFDHKGLDHILKKLEKKELIKKNPKMHRRPFPTYEMTLEGSKDIRIKSNVFSSDCNKILGIQNFHSWLPDSKKLEELVKIVGVYTVFTHLKGKKLSLTKTTKTEQREIEMSWLANSLPMNNVSFFIKQCFFPFLRDNESKKQKISELEEELKDIFPNECSQLEEAYNGLEKRIDDIKIIMREQKERQKGLKKIRS